MKLTHKPFSKLGGYCKRPVVNERGERVGDIVRDFAVGARPPRAWYKVTDRRGGHVYIGSSEREGMQALTELLDEGGQ